MRYSTPAKRPVLIIGGWLSSPDDYWSMATILAQPPYNRIVYITDIKRTLWASLRDPDFSPVFKILASTVEVVLDETGAQTLDLIGHSAGGRIARAYLGDQPYQGTIYAGHRYVSTLITLGTAHATTEIFVARFGKFVNDAYPGAYYPHIFYRSVAGSGLLGRRWGSPETMLAYRSYRLVCGNGDVSGDGVIPTHSCYLTAADNLVLEGVRHAPYNAPRTWYGAPGVVDLWFDDLQPSDTQEVNHTSTSVTTP